jgi:hypothetical protein
MVKMMMLRTYLVMQKTLIRQDGKLKASGILLGIIHLLVMEFQGERYFLLDLKMTFSKNLYYLSVMQFLAFDS